MMTGNEIIRSIERRIEWYEVQKVNCIKVSKDPEAKESVRMLNEGMARYFASNEEAMRMLLNEVTGSRYTRNEDPGTNEIE